MFAAVLRRTGPETAAYASPVFGFNGELVGALSVSGPSHRIEQLGAERIVPVLFKYAREFTHLMGGNIAAPAFIGWRPRTSRS